MTHLPWVVRCEPRAGDHLTERADGPLPRLRWKRFPEADQQNLLIPQEDVVWSHVRLPKLASWPATWGCRQHLTTRAGRQAVSSRPAGVARRCRMPRWGRQAVAGPRYGNDLLAARRFAGAVAAQNGRPKWPSCSITRRAWPGLRPGQVVRHAEQPEARHEGRSLVVTGLPPPRRLPPCGRAASASAGTLTGSSGDNAEAGRMLGRPCRGP